MGFGRVDVSSPIRVPTPPARITTFIESPRLFFLLSFSFTSYLMKALQSLWQNDLDYPTRFEPDRKVFYNLLSNTYE